MTGSLPVVNGLSGDTKVLCHRVNAHLSLCTFRCYVRKKQVFTPSQISSSIRLAWCAYSLASSLPPRSHARNFFIVVSFLPGFGQIGQPFTSQVDFYFQNAVIHGIACCLYSGDRAIRIKVSALILKFEIFSLAPLI